MIDSPFCWKSPCPKRLTLIEAFQIGISNNPHPSLSSSMNEVDGATTEHVATTNHPSKEGDGNDECVLIRIMGIVVTKPEVILSVDQQQQQQQQHHNHNDHLISFVLDDGTALVDVLCSQTNSNDDPSSLYSLGQTVDVVGSMDFVHNPTKQQQQQQQHQEHPSLREESIKANNNHTNNENDLSENFVLCLFAQFISKVPHPNAESLRFVEICCPIHDNHHYATNVIMPGNVASKLGYFHKDSNNILQVDAKQTFHLIQHSKGLSQEDVLILFGCRTRQEQLAVITVLQTLQSNGEIYVDSNGLFLPL